MKRTRYLLPLFALCLLAFTGPGKKWKIHKEAGKFAPGKYLSKTEVSVSEYFEFLDSLKAQGKTDEYERFFPDSTLWNLSNLKSPYSKYYFEHPAFAEYPVACIPHEAAEAYCSWKTEDFARKHPDLEGTVFRLPTEEEWISAAREGLWHGTVYAGGWYYPRNEKGKFVFNHRIGRGDFAGIVGSHPNNYEGYMITAPVKSFPEDLRGLYNLSGNVAEMVAEAGIAKGGSWFHEAAWASPDSVITYQGGSPWVGFRMLIEPAED